MDDTKLEMKFYGLLVLFLELLLFLKHLQDMMLSLVKEQNLQLVLQHHLTNSIPVAGPVIRDAMFGSGFGDFVLRFYAQHVFILPLVMLGLMAVHFPRFLVFDVPMVMAILVLF